MKISEERVEIQDLKPGDLFLLDEDPPILDGHMNGRLVIDGGRSPDGTIVLTIQGQREGVMVDLHPSLTVTRFATIKELIGG